MPVPLAYTHKTNPDEALLTDWRQVAPDTFVIGARWPSRHAFYASKHRLHDPLLLGETVRQTLPLLSHAAYGVPLGHQLLWKDFAWDIDLPALHADGTNPEVELRITCGDVKYRKARAAAMTLSVEARRDGLRLGRARTQFTIQDRTVYERLRGPYGDIQWANDRLVPLPPPAPAQPVGRDAFDDVVLSPTDQTGRWQLRIDPSHPFLFDHPVDHAPGMLLLEAARQAALAATHPQPTCVVGMDNVFHRYAELDAPSWVRTHMLPADTRGRRRVLITIHQGDSEIFTSLVSLDLAPVD